MDPIVLVVLVAFGGSIARRVVQRVIIPKIRNSTKGVSGERIVHRILRRAGKALGKNERFRDILIPGKSQTAQIDNGLITPYGIFVVETKNYTGAVYGDEKKPMWNHAYAGGHKVGQFYNPVMQNNSHIAALRKLLNKYPGVPIYNIVAFSDNCKVSPPDLTNVVYFSNLNAAIQARAGDKVYLTDEQIEDIKDTIDRANMGGKRDRREHVTKASLAAAAAKHGLDEDFKRTLEEGMKQPIIDFGSSYPEQPTSNLDPEQIKLTDEGAFLRINGRTGSIDDFFESAKRDVNNMPVPHGAPFDHFICPYTGESFPVTEAKSFYNGLWTAYLSSYPELVTYIQEKGLGAIESHFRTARVLKAYAADAEAFKAETRDTAWYKNLQAYQAKKRQSLNHQIQQAEGAKLPYAAKGKTFQGYSH